VISCNNYLDVNRRAYDALAIEYLRRADADRMRDIAIVQPFVTYLRRHFLNQPIEILDVGCGNGVNLSMLHNEGFRVTGVDISPRMIEVARGLCPAATLVTANFLDAQWPAASFHGVFAKASLHLMPKLHAEDSMAKAFRLLKTGGLFYITTTLASDAVEGFFEKKDYPYFIKRYRRFWRDDELVTSIKGAGFRLLTQSFNTEPDRGKIWFNVWAVRDC
jgi:SAM-dependent methyltransferase